MMPTIPPMTMYWEDQAGSSFTPRYSSHHTLSSKTIYPSQWVPYIMVHSNELDLLLEQSKPTSFLPRPNMIRNFEVQASTVTPNELHGTSNSPLLWFDLLFWLLKQPKSKYSLTVCVKLLSKHPCSNILAFTFTENASSRYTKEENQYWNLMFHTSATFTVFTVFLTFKLISWHLTCSFMFCNTIS